MTKLQQKQINRLNPIFICFQTGHVYTLHHKSSHFLESSAFRCSFSHSFCVYLNIDWHRSKSITCSRSDATFLFPAAWTQTHRRSQMLTHGAAKKSDSLRPSGWPPVVSMCNPTVWSVRKLSLSVLQKNQFIATSVCSVSWKCPTPCPLKVRGLLFCIFKPVICTLYFLWSN